MSGSAQGSALADIFHVGSSQIFSLACRHFLVRCEARRDKPRIRGQSRNMPPPTLTPPLLLLDADYPHAGVALFTAFCAATLTTEPIKKARHPDMFPKLFLIKSWPELKWKSCSEAQH